MINALAWALGCFCFTGLGLVQSMGLERLEIVDSNFSCYNRASGSSFLGWGFLATLSFIFSVFFNTNYPPGSQETRMDLVHGKTQKSGSAWKPEWIQYGGKIRMDLAWGKPQTRFCLETRIDLVYEKIQKPDSAQNLE